MKSFFTLKLPFLHFLSVIFALGLLAGCKTTCLATQDGGGTLTVSTFVGSEEGFADGTGHGAQFSSPANLTIDAAGNLYLADTENHSIRKITPTGKVSTIAGNGEGGFADGIGSDAQFNRPGDVAIDAAGNLYVADIANHRIRKITPAGVVSTLAGSGEEGFADGIGAAAQFDTPADIAIDAAGNLYVADYENNRIRKITPAGAVSTLAGSGEEGFADGIGSDARFYHPNGITIDAKGNLYVSDFSNHRIRKITPAGKVSTIAGSGVKGSADGTGNDAQFNFPSAITIDSKGNLYMADYDNHRIRKITPAGVVSTLVGSVIGFADGIGSDARFDHPIGIAIDARGNIYVADTHNHRIRKIVRQ